MINDLSLERYSRQMRFGGILEKGQRKLLEARVTLCGCGALAFLEDAAEAHLPAVAFE